MADDDAARGNESVLGLRRRAVWFFRAVLVASTLASIAGNTLHAFMQHYASDESTVMAAGVAMVAPIVLLIMTEALSIAIKCQLPQASAFYAALSTTLIIETIAFLMSFDALRDLAAHNGVRAGLAWFWPLLIDIPAAIAAMWLLILSRALSKIEVASVDRGFEAATAGRDDEGDWERDDARVVAMVGPQRELATATTGDGQPRNERTVHAVIASNRTKQPPEVVREILDHHAAGKKTNEICALFERKDIKLHHSTVSRIIATAMQSPAAV